MNKGVRIPLWLIVVAVGAWLFSESALYASAVQYLDSEAMKDQVGSQVMMQEYSGR